MIASAAPQTGISLMMIEGCLTLLAIVGAFAFPKFGSQIFATIEHRFARLAHNKRLSIAFIGCSALLLRLAMLPVCPIPQPFNQDDFSFLLAADTFAHGRLTNPTPPMWHHFETVHVSMVPSYQSMFFPAEGLALAAGQFLTGHPWFGLLFVNALMCAALCWALQGWLPPTWALLGAALAIVRLALFSCWINTYAGAGSITTLGGALIIGSLPRLMRGVRLRHGVLLAIGIVLLAISRPYEGLLLCFPVLFIILCWIFKGESSPSGRLLLRRATLPLLFVITGLAWLGYYNHRVFGSSLIMPYQLDRAQYAVAPYFVWQSAKVHTSDEHPLMREFYAGSEYNTYKQIHSPSGFLRQLLIRPLRALYFYAGIALLPPLLMLRRVLADRRVRFLVVCLFVLMVGASVEVFFPPYYLGAFVVVFYILGTQAMRHLRLWRPSDSPVGLAIVRFTVALCVLLAVVRVFAQPLHIQLAQDKGGEWAAEWYGPGPWGAARAAVETKLEQMPGRQLAIVHYAPDHDPTDEWVYNAADIDTSKVIWARDMGPAQNAQLIHYYDNRTVWLIQPDNPSDPITPYNSQIAPKSPDAALSPSSTLKNSTIPGQR